MALEIERKFAVLADKLPALENGTTISQGYIPTANGTTVRVRIAGNNAFLCIKTQADNFSRHEYEFPVPVDDAVEMLDKVCHDRKIEKCRYLVSQHKLQWEIDVFHGENEGLIIAEVELNSEQDQVTLPEWIDCEVTNDPRYSNYALALEPYGSWA